MNVDLLYSAAAAGLLRRRSPVVPCVGPEEPGERLSIRSSFSDTMAPNRGTPSRCHASASKRDSSIEAGVMEAGQCANVQGQVDSGYPRHVSRTPDGTHMLGLTFQGLV